MIQTLPLLTPDPHRSERTLSRCHERLARGRAHRNTTGGRGNTNVLVIERALIGGLCLIYISGVALVAIQMLFPAVTR
jgi:hypothetical protein